ncbi:MAG TPA: hypothetical protein VKE26_21215 [Xanthobacteraceae bacterium]|nr:hypothetical protein [Xanthobacteraceae bacterium]
MDARVRGPLPVTGSSQSSAEAFARQYGWSDHELAHLHRATKILWQSGLCLESAGGITDEGEPWYVLCDAESGDIVVHFARIDGQYVACTPFRNDGLKGRVFRDVVNQFLQRQIGPQVVCDVRSTPAA